MSDGDTARLLADTAERIFTRLCTPDLLRDVDARGAQAAHGLRDELARASLDRAMAPESAGGFALGWRDVRPTLEASGRFGAPVPLADTFAAHALARSAGVALPEGPATIGVARAARRRSDEVVVAGVAHASQARWIACTRRAQDGGNRLLVFAAERGRGASTVAISGEERASLAWSAGDAEVDAALPDDCDATVVGAAVRCAQIAGGCSRVVRMATGYANDRVQFGRPIGKFQAVQQQLALAGEWAAMAAMASRLALSSDDERLDRGRVAAAKQVAGTAVETCAAIAHAVHGAIGVTAEYDLQLYTRRLWTWAGDFGSSQHWAVQLGGALLDAGDERVWDEVIRLSTP